MLKSLALFDSCVEYTMRFMEYFKRRGANIFDIIVFTEAESLKEYLLHQKLDILLLGDCKEEDTLELNGCQNIRYIFRLADNKLQGSGGKEHLIYKYQPAGKVMTEILSLYTSLEEGSCNIEREDVRIISIFPPVPGGQYFLFTWSLALYLSDSISVLFIPIESLPFETLTAADVNEGQLSEYIYYLKERNPDISLRLKGLLKYVGRLACLSGLSHGFDTLSLSRQDAAWWIEELKRNKGYDAVIFYHGIYTEAVTELMDRSSLVFIAADGSAYNNKPVLEWERQMGLISLNTEQDKYVKISLPEEKLKHKGPYDMEEIKKSSIWEEVSAIAKKYRLQG